MKNNSSEHIDIVNLEAPDWLEQSYAKHLQNTLNNYKNHPQSEHVKAHELMADLIVITKYFFEQLNLQEETTTRENICERLSTVKEVLFDLVIDKETASNKKAIAIGEFIEGLVHFGFPRLPAIEATSKWMGIGVSTARTYNEKYRNTYNINLSDFSIEGQIIYGLNGIIISNYIDKLDDFPADHPKSQNSFKKLKMVYNRRFFK